METPVAFAASREMYELQEGYLAWHDDATPDNYIGQNVYRSYWTGKEPE